MFIPHQRMIYLTTGEFINKNNTNRKRWGSKNLKKVLNSCGKLPVHHQKLMIENALDLFSTGEKQKDDIAMLGIKL